MKQRELQNEGFILNLKGKFSVKQKGFEVVHEKVRQRLVALGTKLERYDNRTKH